MIEQEPFLAVGEQTHFYHNEATYERLCDGSVVEKDTSLCLKGRTQLNLMDGSQSSEMQP